MTSSKNCLNTATLFASSGTKNKIIMERHNKDIKNHKTSKEMMPPIDHEKSASIIIRRIYYDIEKHGFSREPPFIIGNVERRMKQYAKENNIELGSSEIYMSAHLLSHAERDHKVCIGKAVSKENIIDFPSNRHNMKMSYDGEAFIFTDENAKYVLHPNYEIKINRKRERKVVFITATKIG